MSFHVITAAALGGFFNWMPLYAGMNPREWSQTAECRRMVKRNRKNSDGVDRDVAPLYAACWQSVAYHIILKEGGDK